MAVDGAGNAYLAGRTASPDFPAAVGPDLTPNGTPGDSDAFVAKVDAAAVKFTIAHYLTPKKRAINGIGLTPDLIVVMDPTLDAKAAPALAG